MYSFEVLSHGGFKPEFTGIVIPDDGYKHHFHNEVANYYGIESPTVGLFVSELLTTQEIPYIQNGVELAELQALITFGVHNERAKEGETHLNIIARELSLPLLKLIVPSGYPKIEALDPTTKNRFVETWIENNPLKSLYNKQVIVSQSEEIATFQAV